MQPMRNDSAVVVVLQIRKCVRHILNVVTMFSPVPPKVHR